MNNTVEKMTFLDFPRQSSYSIQVRWANIQAVDVTNKQTNRHYENNGHLAVNQKPRCSEETVQVRAKHCHNSTLNST